MASICFRAGAGFGVTALFFSFGCGGQKPAETPVVATAPPASSEAAPLAALTPLAPSPELFAVARVSNLEKVSDTAVSWSGLPVNWRSLLEKEVPGITRIATLSAPLDFAATIDPGSGETPRFFWAFSLGVASTDAAVSFFRQQSIGVTPADGGTYRVSIGNDLSCIVARALGASPARVVCSDNADGAAALYPYMTRGMPTEVFGASDVHAHVMAEPFRRRYGAQIGLVRTVGVPFLLRELAVDNPKLDRALHDVLYGGADEVVAIASDADRMDLDVGIPAGSDVIDLSLSLSLGGTKSWWGETMAKASGQMGTAPEAFWKLPASATSATYNAYSNPERFRSIALSLRDLLDGLGDYMKLSEPRRRGLVDSFEKIMTIGAKSVTATLPMVPPPAGAVPSELDQVKLAVGQHIGISDKGGAEATAFFSEVVKTINDKGLRDHLVKTHHVPAAMLPTAREKPLTGKNVPAGSKRFEVTLPGALFGNNGHFSFDNAARKPKGKPQPPLTVLALTIPDGPFTWFAAGTDEKQLLAAVNEARAGTGKTLATRDGLAQLRSEAVLSGGFSTLAAIVGGIDRRIMKAGKAPLALDKLPHLGMSPILFSLTSAVKGAGPKVTFVAKVPKAVVEDSVGLAATEVARGSN